MKCQFNTKQNPSAETAHDCFMSVCYECDVEVVSRHDMIFLLTIAVLQLLPHSFILFCHTAYSKQTFFAISAQRLEDNSANIHF